MTTFLDFSTAKLRLSFSRDDYLRLEHYGLHNWSWMHPSAAQPLFAVYVPGARHDATTLKFTGLQVDYRVAGVQHIMMSFTGQVEVVHHLKVYADTGLIEVWQVVTNRGTERFQIDRVDSFALNVPPDAYTVLYYTSHWGSEFTGVSAALRGPLVIDSKAGRSSKGHHPWFALTSEAGAVLSASVAWSGNWVCRFEPLEAGGFALSGGLHDWSFAKTLAPGAAMTTPPVVMVVGADLNAISQDYARVGRKYWYPRTTLSALPPVEWNHWWPYEDDHISEQVFGSNVAVAAEMGIDVCVLDAGWFGPSGANTFWTDYRGDWDLVNQARFPAGLRPIADDVHQKGMKFGLWCEIEAIGPKARLAETRPELVAKRDGESLGYVCLGNPEAQVWAYQTLSRLIVENALDWIKLDFNLDPGAGCNRTDHGHGEGDGLYEHYLGYYGVLERLREAYPEVVLESCSSGGMRIDLGLLRRTDMTYLSDPDWPVHSLQLFWGASTMLAPDSLLHWSFSEWINKNPPPPQTFNPRDPRLRPHQLDYYTRIAMLNVFGLSQRLPDLPAWVHDRLSHHIKIYQDHVRRFVREADLYRLTAQPQRDGSGERWCAFQYSLPADEEHLLFVFRLPGAEAERQVGLTNLSPERLYTIQGFEGEVFAPQRGAELMTQGIRFGGLPPESSWLLRVV
ncbi:MAG: alpha-galactosidase [Truepera sp.]|nr:alpha-galactosidase [Truepera sp.]